MSLDAIDAEAESARDERSDPALPAAEGDGGAPVDSDPARPSGDVVAAIVATLRHVAAIDFHADQEWAQMWYDAATNVELAGADRDVCPVCEEVACDDDCPLAPYRDEDYRRGDTR